MMKRIACLAAVFVVAALVGVLAAGCGGGGSKTTPTTTPSKGTVKTYTIADKSITAKVGETFIIELESNPTTGYQWSITGPLSPALQKVSSQYVPSKTTSSNVVGSGGVEKWTFKAVGTGDAVIQMEYLQAGSNQSGGNANFDVTVK